MEKFILLNNPNYVPQRTNGITITFSESCENHVGMEMIGQIAEKGFSIEELQQVHDKLIKQNYKCELINLKQNNIQPDAAILVIRNGVHALLAKEKNDETLRCANDLYDELNVLKWDKKALMNGKVVTKHARQNLCFANVGHEPDYENGMGRVIPFDNTKLLKICRKTIGELIGDSGTNLFAEGNNYIDIKKCGIGYHGDSERRKVVAIRLGASYPICYQWFHSTKPVGDRIKIELQHGDVYIMSSVAVGTDWKKLDYQLRHAAGCEKYITVPK